MKPKILGYDARDVRDGDEYSVIDGDTFKRLGMITRCGRHWAASSRGEDVQGGSGYVTGRGYESAMEAADALARNSTS